MGGPEPVAGRGPAPWAFVAVAAVWAAAVLLAVGAAVVAPGLLVRLPELVAVYAAALVPLLLGTLVARAEPGSSVGPLLACCGLSVVAASSFRPDVLGPFAGSWMLLYLAPAVLLLVVPDGRAGSARRRGLGWAMLGVVLAFNALVALEWVHGAGGRWAQGVALGLLPVFLVLLLACAAAPVARFRVADEAQRGRLGWVLLAGWSMPLALLLCWAGYLVLGTPELAVYGLVVVHLAIPVGVAVAVLRPARFDVDAATLATATTTLLAGAVLAVLSLACAAVGLTLAQWWPPAAVVVVAVLTTLAALLHPRLQRALERAFYPERPRCVAALRALSERVAAGSAHPCEVEGVLRETLRDHGLRVAHLHGAGSGLQHLDGSPAVRTPATVPVYLRGTEVGAIICSPERVKRPGTEVVRATAPLLDAVRTDAVVAAALSEVEASRARLLRAGYEERRRLERDLHDGAQQRLVALGMRMRVLQRSVGADGSLDAALEAAVAEIATAVSELRSIAHGVRPSTLDDGLGAALADLQRLAPEVVELDVDAPELPDAITTTAYFVAGEALANALRHSGASRIRITAQHVDGTLTVRVDDDGAGGAAPAPGGGLTGLADRVGALGGTLTLDSRPGTGTTVEARLPCGS
ncbi:hypothetical protein GCM10028820_10690 [Tessaracoccus terricola]